MEPEQREFSQKFDRLKDHAGKLTQASKAFSMFVLLTIDLLRNLNERLAILEDRQSNEDREAEDERDW